MGAGGAPCRNAGRGARHEPARRHPRRRRDIASNRRAGADARLRRAQRRGALPARRRPCRRRRSAERRGQCARRRATCKDARRPAARRDGGTWCARRRTPLLARPRHALTRLAGAARRARDSTEHHRRLRRVAYWNASRRVAAVVLRRRRAGHGVYVDRDTRLGRAPRNASMALMPRARRVSPRRRRRDGRHAAPPSSACSPPRLPRNSRDASSCRRRRARPATAQAHGRRRPARARRRRAPRPDGDGAEPRVERGGAARPARRGRSPEARAQRRGAPAGAARACSGANWRRRDARTVLSTITSTVTTLCGDIMTAVRLTRDGRARARTRSRALSDVPRDLARARPIACVAAQLIKARVPEWRRSQGLATCAHERQRSALLQPVDSPWRSSHPGASARSKRAAKRRKATIAGLGSAPATASLTPSTSFGRSLNASISSTSTFVAAVHPESAAKAPRPTKHSPAGVVIKRRARGYDPRAECEAWVERHDHRTRRRAAARHYARGRRIRRARRARGVERARRPTALPPSATEEPPARWRRRCRRRRASAGSSRRPARQSRIRATTSTTGATSARRRCRCIDPRAPTLGRLPGRHLPLCRRVPDRRQRLLSGALKTTTWDASAPADVRLHDVAAAASRPAAQPQAAAAAHRRVAMRRPCRARRRWTSLPTLSQVALSARIGATIGDCSPDA